MFKEYMSFCPQVQKQMAREYEQLKTTMTSLQMFQHEGEKGITPMAGSKYIKNNLRRNFDF